MSPATEVIYLSNLKQDAFKKVLLGFGAVIFFPNQALTLLQLEYGRSITGTEMDSSGVFAQGSAEAHYSNSPQPEVGS